MRKQGKPNGHRNVEKRRGREKAGVQKDGERMDGVCPSPFQILVIAVTAFPILVAVSPSLFDFVFAGFTPESDDGGVVHILQKKKRREISRYRA